jgi:CHAT domain-containing protein
MLHRLIVSLSLVSLLVSSIVQAQSSSLIASDRFIIVQQSPRPYILLLPALHPIVSSSSALTQHDRNDTTKRSTTRRNSKKKSTTGSSANTTGQEAGSSSKSVKEEETRWEYLLQSSYTKAVKDDYDAAISLAQNSLDEINREPQPDAEKAARITRYLGLLHYAKGNYRAAEELYLRAVQIKLQHRANTAGLPKPNSGNQETAMEWLQLGTLYQAKGDQRKAILSFANAIDKEDDFFFQTSFKNLLDENVRLRWAKMFSPTTDKIISFHLSDAPRDQNAARLAMTTILRRKGRVLDSLIESRRLRRVMSSEDLNFYYQVTAAKDTFELSYASEAFRQAQRELLRNLESSFASRLEGKAYYSWRPETLEEIQEHIPPNTALLEFVKYRRFNANATRNDRRWDATHYAVYVLRSEGEPYGVDLGPTAEIDALINDTLDYVDKSSWRVSDRDRAAALAAYKDLAKRLYTRLIKPITSALGDTKQTTPLTVFVSPDGQLNLIPFNILIDDNDSYLIENYSFVYLGSGRDLLHIEQSPNNSVLKSGPPAVLAYPNYDRAERGPALPNSKTKGCALLYMTTRSKGRIIGNSKEEKRSSDNRIDKVGNCGEYQGAPLNSSRFSPLEGARKEAAYLCTTLRDATVVVGPQATESFLENLGLAPVLLHVATHGIFSPKRGGRGEDILYYEDEYRRTLESLIGLAAPTYSASPDTEGALADSYLALAGANKSDPSKSTDTIDGLLRSSEVSKLNLWGTKLTVLSACGTAKGYVADGEGVFGLRRALFQAGTESQVITLWNVADSVGPEIMSSYYKGLQSGQGRAEALRKAQLSVLKGNCEEHRRPYYWAPFIFTGAWTSLSPNVFVQAK